MGRPIAGRKLILSACKSVLFKSKSELESLLISACLHLG
jgi:hypothetical protein